MNDKKDIKKETILTVAEKFFARFGLRKTTMDEIAKTARIGKSTLYYYFKSKEDIFAAVIRKESRILKSKLEENIARAANPREKLSAYVLTRMKHLKELSNYYSSLTDEYPEHYSFVERTREDFTKYEIDTLKTILAEGIEKGVFQIADVDTAAQAIVITMKGLEYPLLLQEDAGNMEDTIHNLLNILFKGIESRP
ncbi:MAG: TetR/AcrR family transcriptional regulator [FCB group bacterium]|nr:TetR/AcrR family transcriptional regulator [FCB group bacterium]